MRLTLSSLLFLALSASCGGSSGDNDRDNTAPDAMAQTDASPESGSDAMPSGGDAMPSATTLPGWMLKDIQPLSPRFGETYGLSAIEDKILVAVLVQGF